MLTLYLTHKKLTLVNADALFAASRLPANSVDLIVTSPPYYGLRDYGYPEQIGLEQDFSEYISKLVTLFGFCYSSLKTCGVFVLNIGDSYVGNASPGGANTRTTNGGAPSANKKIKMTKKIEGLKPKSLIGVPWRLAFALQESGWLLRQELIWHKPNAFPENVTDRFARNHEQIFIFCKEPNYYCNSSELQEMGANGLRVRKSVIGFNVGGRQTMGHYATYPIELADLFIRAFCPIDGMVLDPFAGSCSTGVACARNNRHFLGFELSQEYFKSGSATLTSL